MLWSGTVRPDVVLMDLRLRDMNGILAIEALDQEFPGARIIVLTSHTGIGWHIGLSPPVQAPICCACQPRASMKG
jgi:DNA-binding NarL/FixJ family response regulator